MAAGTTAVPRRRNPVLAFFGLTGLAAREAGLGYAIGGIVYVFLAAFVFAPMALAFYVSLTKWDALSPLSQARFVGLQNYIDLANDNRFHQSMVHDFEW